VRGGRLDLQGRHVWRTPVDDANSTRTDAYWITDLLLAHEGLGN
jgi:hypothetical protein